MKYEDLFDLPITKKSAVIRKGLGFLSEPVARLQRALVDARSYENRPPIIANSLPKSGTHLLLQATRALPNTRYLGRFIASSPSRTQKEKTPHILANAVRRILPGETLGTHLFYSPEVASALQEINALHLFIYRDPRDVIISEAFYLAEMNRWHRMHKHFAKLENGSDRLNLALKGLDERYPECNARLLPYAGWLEDPNTLAIRYEDISGVNQERELRRIATWFLHRAPSQTTTRDALVKKMVLAIDPNKSHTFREGGAGKWKEKVPTNQQEKFSKHLTLSIESFGYNPD